MSFSALDDGRIFEVSPSVNVSGCVIALSRQMTNLTTSTAERGYRTQYLIYTQ